MYEVPSRTHLSLKCVGVLVEKVVPIEETTKELRWRVIQHSGLGARYEAICRLGAKGGPDQLAECS